MTPEERQAVLEDHAKRESDFTRLQRQRMTSADFENLTIIGRGAFGEVSHLLEEGGGGAISGTWQGVNWGGVLEHI